MSERPTPETDAELNLYFRNGESHQVSVAWIDFSRKLERERDEAREALENYTASTVHSCHDQCKRPFCVLRRERDEARADRDIARLAALESDRSHDRMVGEVERAYKERDEAREALCHLRACVFDALSALDAGAFAELKKAWEEGAK
jgi:hypothetical protein